VTLQPGCRLIVAPSFHIPVNWSERVRLGSGTDWRVPDDAELGLLVGDPALLTARDLPECLCLFRLPRHLHEAWWRLVEQTTQDQSRLEGFDAFAVEVARFLAFKDLPLPEGAAFELLVSRPGQASTGWQRSPRLWGGINLGDEPTSLVYRNPSCPDHLLARLRIEPGEGFRGPAGGLLADGCSLDRQQPDMMLLIRDALSSGSRCIP
jgi:hypothetical protein